MNAKFILEHKTGSFDSMPLELRGVAIGHALRRYWWLWRGEPQREKGEIE